MQDKQTTIELDAIQFTQTTRTGWVGKMTAGDLAETLPARPPEQLSFLTETNRPISQNHLSGIIHFLENTHNWALPGIALATQPGRIEQGRRKNTIRVPREGLRILDGQHRIQAIRECLANARMAVERGQMEENQREELAGAELPVAIFEVAEDREQRQMFAWFARSKPIDTPTREWFDQSDPFRNAAREVMETSAILQGRVERQKGKTNRPEVDRHLLTLSELKDTAATIAIGIQRSPRETDREIYREEEKQAQLQAELAEFFDDFLPACGEGYQGLRNGTPGRDTIEFHRRETYHLYPYAIRLLANCWARMKKDQNTPVEPLADHIAGLNLNRSDPGNDFRKNLGIIDEREKPLRSNNRGWEKATEQIIQAARRHREG